MNLLKMSLEPETEENNMEEKGTDPAEAGGETA